MSKKRGITLALLTVIIMIMGILTTVTVKSISSSYKNAKLSVWVSEIGLIQDLMDENKNNLSHVIMDDIILDTSNFDTDMLNEQFNGEKILLNEIMLETINLPALGVNNTLYGTNSSKLDVYAYSQVTGKVYYLKGMKVGAKEYYTLTPEIKNRFGDNITVGYLTLIAFEQSELNATTDPVKVTVKVPKTYTNVTITTSNEDIEISSVETKVEKNVYTVNTNGVKTNYVITVNYTEDGTEKTVTHTVKNVY